MKTFNLLFLLSLSKLFLCQCDDFTFNYHLFDTDESCTTATWTYHGRTCTPVTYSVRGFYLEEVISGHLSVPRVEFNTSSPTLVFPSSQFTEEPVYFRILGLNSANEICATSDFFDFTANSMDTRCLTPLNLPLCFSIPTDSSNRIPYLILPKTSRHADGYCFCPAQTAMGYSDCTEFCRSIYHFSLSSDDTTLCLQNDISGDDVLKVFIAYLNDFCPTSQCVITSFSTYIWIRSQAFCSESDLEEVVPIFNVSLHNSTINFGENLHINITDSSDVQLTWRHNGYALRNSRASYGNGSLTIEAVEPSDAGHYSVLQSGVSGCEIAHFDVFVRYINITSESYYSCVATGYPDVQLLMWQSGTGDVIPQSHYNTSSEEHEFSTTLVSTLAVDDRDCTQSRGYTCVFSNGGSPAFVRSLDIHCVPGPPGEPQVIIDNWTNNFSVCFDAYSYPRHTVVYNVNITINSTLHYYSLNGSQCINFMFEDNVCSSFEVAVIASNQLGETMLKTEHYDVATDDSFCRNLLLNRFSLIQIHLQGVLNCTKWISVDLIHKVMAFSDKLANFIRNSCQCDFPANHIHQPNFECFDNIPNYTTFRAQVVALSDTWSSTQLVHLVENRVLSEKSVSILGEVLQINKQCPVVVTTTLDISDCLSPGATLTLLTVGSTVSSITVVVLLASVFIVCGLLVRRKKRKSRQNPSLNLQDSPVYNEVAEPTVQNVPVYEEIPPKNDSALGATKYTPCEAYAVMKKISASNYHEYEDIEESKTKFSITKCAAYANPKIE